MTIRDGSIEADLAPEVAATFVPVDPARGSWFALWDPNEFGALITSGVGNLEKRELDVIAPLDGEQAIRRQVTVSRLPMPQAIDLFAGLARSAPVHPTLLSWAAIVRTALDLVARGRLLPTVSPEGFDSWAVGPLGHEHLRNMEALAASLPAIAHCLPAAEPAPADPSQDLIIDPLHIVNACLDAVGDRMIRSPAASLVSSSPIFAHKDPTRVRHLRPWTEDVAAPHRTTTGVVFQMHPPETDSDEWQVRFRLRSRLDPSLIIDAAEFWNQTSDVGHLFDLQSETDLLSTLRKAVGSCKSLGAALSQSEPTSVVLDASDVDDLIDCLDDLASLGIEVRWPSEFVAPAIERRLVVGASAPAGSQPSFTSLSDLLSVDWEFLIDGLVLSKDELAALSEAKRGVVSVRGRWVRLDNAARNRLRAPVPTITGSDVLPALLAGQVEVGSGLISESIDLRADSDLADLAARVRSIDGTRTQVEPTGLAAELRPYQRCGLAWMADLCSLGLGGCLADDMGLGKTVQVLALHAHRGGPTLVVCPTSVVANWEREAARFLPGTQVRRYHGPGRSLTSVNDGDLVVTTYGVVRSDAAKLASHSWDLVVADEAQLAKNPRSRTAKSLRSIPSTCRMALTGTPVENRLSELWSIIDWAVPGLLGPFDGFRRTLSIPIERDNCSVATANLQRLIQPFLLRRKKSDPGIAPELPPKIERNVVVPLTEEQVSLYQATTKEVLEDVRENEGLIRHGLVLKLLTGLKQIANHPAQYLSEPGPLAGRSGKLAALDQLVELAIDQGEAMLIFSQYVQMGELLVRHLGDRGVESDLLHGGQSVAVRQQLVDRFQANQLPVLVLSLKAAGTGLNLTSASHVVHYDRWWNPAVEDQATDRAYRIGQDKTVTVHRLIAEGTVEDRVAELLEQKRTLADRVVGSGEGWVGQLDDAALSELVTLETVSPR